MSVNSVEESIRLAVEQVYLAYQQKTFAVGGILMDIAGNVFHVMHNDVVQDGLVKDPTAHGERQLIDWYYQNRESRQLPPPEKMVLVTSLDPCAMCTGAILSSGFNLVIISARDQFAGINYNLKADFPTLRGSNMDWLASHTLAYPEIRGSSEPAIERDASGAAVTIFPEDSRYIEVMTAAMAEGMFTSTVEEVSATINNDWPSSALKDLALEGSSNWIYQEVVSRYPDAFKYKSPVPGTPNRDLAPYLIQAAQKDRANGGDGNAVAFLDYFGNLLFCAHGTQNISPIQNAFMRATRHYAELRYTVAKRGTREALKYLCHPKFGTFVMLKEPMGDSLGLMTMGAYGSTMEGEIPNTKQLQFVLEQNTPNIYPYIPIRQIISQMPPFYTDVVKVTIDQVSDHRLIEEVERYNF